MLDMHKGMSEHVCLCVYPFVWFSLLKKCQYTV
jgi:hypothetical protein